MASQRTKVSSAEMRSDGEADLAGYVQAHP